MFGFIDWILRGIANYLNSGLTAVIRWVVGLFGLNDSFLKSERYKGAIDFFFYDSLKILLMLCIIIFIVSVIRSFFPPERTKKFLGEGKARGFLGNVFAALLGIVTPFCSCSAVPVFIGFIEAGVPLGVTFSFLISSPMVNEIAVGLLWDKFGWRIALLYIVSGVTLAIVAGLLIGKLKMERFVEDYVYQIKMGSVETIKPTWRQRFIDAWHYVIEIIKKIWPYVIVAIGIGAWMHSNLPQGWLSKYAGESNPFAVFISVLIGIPLYSNAAGTIPIVSELTRLGMPMGTALAFMMSVTALSLPEMIILRKVLKPRLLATFIGIMAVSIIFIGYLFNFVIN